MYDLYMLMDVIVMIVCSYLHGMIMQRILEESILCLLILCCMVIRTIGCILFTCIGRIIRNWRLAEIWNILLIIVCILSCVRLMNRYCSRLFIISLGLVRSIFYHSSHLVMNPYRNNSLIFVDIYLDILMIIMFFFIKLY